MVKTTLVIVMGALVLGAAEARAVGVSGASCTPGDPAIQADRYFITAGSVNYRAGASGPVTLYCPVTIPPMFPPHCSNLQYKMRLTYTDSDGAGDAVSVTAQLLRLSNTTGAFQGVVGNFQIASNASDTTVRTNQTAQWGWAFNQNKDYYYFRVDMNRAAGTSHVATFYGVGLECAD